MLPGSTRCLSLLLALLPACGGDDSSDPTTAAETHAASEGTASGGALTSTDAGDTTMGAGTSTGTSTGTSSSTGEATKCEQAGTLLCERACACDPSPECRVANQSGSVLTFDDLDDCLGLYVQSFCVVQGGNPAVDYDQCFADIDPVMCSSVAAEAVEIPPSCTG